MPDEEKPPRVSIEGTRSSTVIVVAENYSPLDLIIAARACFEAALASIASGNKVSRRELLETLPNRFAAATFALGACIDYIDEEPPETPLH